MTNDPRRVQAEGGEEWLAEAFVADTVFALRPDYEALLIVAEGLAGGASDSTSDELLDAAERDATARMATAPVQDLPHVAQWREAFRAFGAKPQRTRNSLEALTRRAADGLPRVDRLTDTYNAVSVLHQVPIGGEDLAGYSGPAQLVRATGEEAFDTTAQGEAVIEHPEPGEVIWRDDEGVTCRRWNWRQCRRTQLSDTTRSALFILDGLSALGTGGLLAAGEDLTTRLRTANPGVLIVSRLISRDHPSMSSEVSSH